LQNSYDVVVCVQREDADKINAKKLVSVDLGIRAINSYTESSTNHCCEYNW